MKKRYKEVSENRTMESFAVSILVLLDLVTSYFMIICKNVLFSGGERV